MLNCNNRVTLGRIVKYNLKCPDRFRFFNLPYLP
uniref:Uncharacterized protein n=1 Tax=Anguilla anguilla TaxID=7936 RepID=A0A0E9TR68_ANGAN